MATTETNLSAFLSGKALAIANFLGRLLFLLFVIAVGGAGIVFSSARLEYDLKYEEIASPILHYLALLSFSFLPAAALLTAVSKKRDTALAMIVVCTTLFAFSLPLLIAAPFYVACLYILAKRIRTLSVPGK